MNDGHGRLFLIKRSFAPLVLCLAALVVLRAPWHASLWLDETISAWVTGENFSAVLHRALHYQGQSPLYFAVLWAVRAVFGPGEFWLRLPSLCFAFLSCLLLFRVALALWPAERQAGWLAVIFLLTRDAFLVAAVSARPYAFALALALGSVLALLKWLKEEKTGWAVLYVATSALTFYAHYFFAAIMLVHLIFLFRTSSVGKGLLLLTLVALLCIPGLWQLSLLYQKKTLLAYQALPGVGLFFFTVFPATLIVYLAAAFVVARACGAMNLVLPDKQERAPLLFWWLAGPILFFVASHAGGNSLFASKYLLWSFPGLALLCGRLLAAVTLPRARLAAVLVVWVLMLVREGERQWMIEDWRGAAEAINRLEREGPLPLLLYSGLTESDQVPAGSSPEYLSYLAAPFAYYSISVTPIVVPSRLEAGNAYVEDHILPVLAGSRRVLLTALQIKPPRTEGRPYVHESLLGSLSSYGFSRQSLAYGELVKVFLLEKQAGP